MRKKVFFGGAKRHVQRQHLIKKSHISTKKCNGKACFVNCVCFVKRVKGKKSPLKEEILFRIAIFHSDLLKINIFVFIQVSLVSRHGSNEIT